MLFPDFCLYVWQRNRELEAAAERERQERALPGFREDGFDPPARDELASIPWGGEGPDPLDVELQELLEDESR